MMPPIHWADDINADRRGVSLPGDTTLDDYREDYESSSRSWRMVWACVL